MNIGAIERVPAIVIPYEMNLEKSVGTEVPTSLDFTLTRISEHISQTVTHPEQADVLAVAQGAKVLFSADDGSVGLMEIDELGRQIRTTKVFTASTTEAKLEVKFVTEKNFVAIEQATAENPGSLHLLVLQDDGRYLESTTLQFSEQARSLAIIGNTMVILSETGVLEEILIENNTIRYVGMLAENVDGLVYPLSDRSFLVTSSTEITPWHFADKSIIFEKQPPIPLPEWEDAEPYFYVTASNNSLFAITLVRHDLEKNEYSSKVFPIEYFPGYDPSIALPGIELDGQVIPNNLFVDENGNLKLIYIKTNPENTTYQPIITTAALENATYSISQVGITQLQKKTDGSIPTTATFQIEGNLTILVSTENGVTVATPITRRLLPFMARN